MVALGLLLLAFEFVAAGSVLLIADSTVCSGGVVFLSTLVGWGLGTFMYKQ